MLRALILAVLVVASTTTLLGPRIDFDAHWHNFKVKYGKSYNDVEEYFRRGIFVRNLVRVLNHNFEQDLGLHSYRLAMNKFTDMLPSEVPKGYKGYKRSGMKMSHQFSLIRGKIPDSVDWRDKGLVTPIKDQAQCGSCWAFSAVASLEGQHAKAVKKLISLSEQNLVDCSGPEGNNGCDGGLMDQAFTYVIKNRGIDTEDSYPYEAKNGKCRFRNSTVGAIETSFVDVQSGNEKALQHAVATIGPISVGIDANSDAFQAYAGGVYEPADCKSDQEDLDHGVAVVGYGKDEQSGKDYWLVKNSWGTDWGESGYIKMARNKNNLCGIATSASYPVVPSL